VYVYIYKPYKPGKSPNSVEVSGKTIGLRDAPTAGCPNSSDLKHDVHILGESSGSGVPF